MSSGFPPDRCAQCGRNDFVASGAQWQCAGCGAVAQDAPVPDGAPPLQQTQWVKVLALALPRWSAQHGAAVRIELSVQDGGVVVNFHASRPLSSEEEGSLLRRIGLADQIVAHQVLVDAMKELGVDPDKILSAVTKGRELAAEFQRSSQE